MNAIRADMAYCREEGKDRIIFTTEEEQSTPSNIKLPDDDADEEPGLILPSGEINWNCPCLGGMGSGPCGVEFREAFSCFHYSTDEMKGSDCVESFRTMQGCMQQYPDLYPEAQKGSTSAELDDMPDFIDDEQTDDMRVEEEPKQSANTKS